MQGGVKLRCPSDAAASGPIPVEVEMTADARTYWDNQGILDNALTVALVRRDRPGLQFLAKVDREAIMSPESVLPGRPADADLDADTSVTVEEKTLDARGGSVDAGAAEYFVIAAFSKWWVMPGRLRIQDSQGRVRAFPDRPRPIDTRLDRRARREQTPIGLSITKDRVDGRAVLRASLRGPRSAGPHDTVASRPEKPWLTVLGFHLRERGGASGGLFALGERNGVVGEVDAVVPFSALTPAVNGGRWIFFAFVGDESSAPTEILLNDADAR